MVKAQEFLEQSYPKSERNENKKHNVSENPQAESSFQTQIEIPPKQNQPPII